MTLTRRDWWLGIALLALAILVHALLPRYEYRSTGGRAAFIAVRVDHWRGRAQVGTYSGDHNEWISLEERNAQSAAKIAPADQPAADADAVAKQFTIHRPSNSSPDTTSESLVLVTYATP